MQSWGCFICFGVHVRWSMCFKKVPRMSSRQGSDLWSILFLFCFLFLGNTSRNKCKPQWMRDYGVLWCRCRMSFHFTSFYTWYTLLSFISNPYCITRPPSIPDTNHARVKGHTFSRTEKFVSSSPGLGVHRTRSRCIIWPELYFSHGVRELLCDRSEIWSGHGWCGLADILK